MAGRRTTVLVLAKEPLPGKVKTRLCPPCTPSEAALVAEAALADTLEAVASTNADRRVLALDGRPGPWLPPGFDVVRQVDGPLDRRLTGAWSMVDGPCVQIGMDTPQVTTALLDDALARLAAPATDAVLGPAADGGWWAIGLRTPHPLAFAGVPMSTDVTGARQHERLVLLGLRVAALDVLRDIDTFADATAVAALTPRSRTARQVARLTAAATAVA